MVYFLRWIGHLANGHLNRNVVIKFDDRHIKDIDKGDNPSFGSIINILINQLTKC